MRRNLFSLALALSAALLLAAPAAADVIWEPEEGFYTEHAEQCDYVGRQYLLDGYGGTVSLWSEPGGTVKKKLENGAAGMVQFTWQGEDCLWGYLYGVEDAEGWVPMDDLSLIYDCQQFLEDHQGEILEGEPAQVKFHQAVLYDYPRGPVGYVLEEEPEYEPFSQVFTRTYTDEGGLRWGHIGYYMGHRNSWVCLDDPMNEELDTGIVHTPPSAAQLRGSPTVEEKGGDEPLALAALLVAAVAAATLVLIRKFIPRKKRA